MAENSSRRKFIKNAAIAGAGFTIVPSLVMGKKFGFVSPSDKLNIAGIGVGGMGFANLKNMQTENIVGLCDVDWKYAKGAFDFFPKAKKYQDYRRMYDELGKSIDGIVVATADHTHALVAADAITMGKHAYVQKPLTHSVYESRLLNKLAAKHKVATQMGNQGASGEGVRQICEYIWSGGIGQVKRVDCFTDRPIWPQGLPRPEGNVDVPSTLSWDLFLGPAPVRPYNPIYTPWNWRGWWDFGTGALGDMACHILHPVYKALQLGHPTKVQGSSTLLLTECAPNAQSVRYTFPERKSSVKVKMPEVDVYWYDGGIKPERPPGMPAGKDMNDSGGGCIFYGTKDILVCGCYGVNPWLISGKPLNGPKTLRRVETSHEMDWVRAAKESAANRVETTSPFSEAGPLNEMVVMGVLAVRLQDLDRELMWDGENMQFTNINDSDKIQTIIKDGFKIHDGHPTFDKTKTEPVSAKEFAQSLIKHNYREGWKLPDMPV